MAKALWEQPITKKDDWGGGKFSGGAPVSGKVVQDFIKETLNKKFGYLYYNNADGKGKYYIFADQSDFDEWYLSPSSNADLVLATFDAPAPATITTKTLPKVSPESVTMRFGDTITPIVFHYFIKDNSGNAVLEDVIMRVTATSSSSVKSEVITIPRTEIFESHKKTEAQYAIEDTENKYGYDPTNTNPIGARYTYNRLNRLLTTADKYSIDITLTGVTTQVSTTLTFEYQLVDLSISTDFNYLSSIKDTDDEFSQNINVKGAEGYAKILTLKIDGYELKQNPATIGIDASRIISSGNSLGQDNDISKQIEIFMLDSNDNPICWPNEPGYEDVAGNPIFTPGKHTLELSTHINLDALGTKTINSKTLYFNFAIASEGIEQTYLLYKSELDSSYQPGEKIQLSGTQYSQIEYTIGLFTTQKRSVPIKYFYTKEGTKLNDINHTLKNGEIDEVKYTLRESGIIDLLISAYDSSNNVVDTIEIEINSEELEDIVIGEKTLYNIFKFSAENRNNNDPDREYWHNTSKAYATQYDTYDATINKVNFINNVDGWDGTSLTLKNSATVTFPFNLFNLPAYANGTNENATNGFTFEIDFETIDVQDDDAIIMDFCDRNGEGLLNYNSYITIKATSAEMSTQNGTKININFKAGERIKLAFIVNPLKNTVNYQYDPSNTNTDDNPNTLFIMVNGVLERVVRYGTGNAGSDSMKWGDTDGVNANSFTIGNKDGKANLKLYSIRVYNTALTLDEEFNNYMSDQTGEELTTIFDKNNILKNKEIDFEKVRTLIPTMLVGMDYTSFKGFTALEKKANTFAEVQYWDPDKKDGSMNFYARQCWISPQGTSSMSYPIKNLRLYFCKGWTATTDKNNVRKLGTFQYNHTLYKTDDTIDTEYTDERVTTPVYETEFWPYSEYKSKGDKVLVGTTDMDDILPYAVNKKVDGKEGSNIVVGNSMDDLSSGTTYRAVHEGYHMIGGNRTVPGRVELVKKYVKLKEYDPTTINVEAHTIDEKPIKLYWIKPGTQPIIVKDAFGDPHTVFATSGMDGYLKQPDNSWSAYRTEQKNAAGEDINTPITYDAFTSMYDENTTLTSYLDGLTDAELTDFFTGNDVYISAYRPLLRTGETIGSESYKTYLDELRYSGVKLFYWNGKKFKNHKEKINYNELYYSLGANWRQYDDHTNAHGYGAMHISGWTDRWTIKADYAESSMTHNGGIGRLWGNAMYNVSIGNEKKCQTNAQQWVGGAIDIRTSCDCKPIVLFYKQINGFDEATGLPVYDAPKFGGIYNIMTDKSSTKLFGFENITDPAGKKWKAYSDNPEDNRCTECWECTNNGSDIIKGLSTAFDTKKNGTTVGSIDDVGKPGKIGDGRQLWDTYESRWPDTGQERHEYNPETNPLGNNWGDDVYGVDTKNLEKFLRWVNFCKTAINYTIGEGQNTMDGYDQNIFIKLDAISAVTQYDAYTTALSEYDAATSRDERDIAEKKVKEHTLYKQWEKDGNIKYVPIGDTYEVTVKDDENNDVIENVTVTWDLDKATNGIDIWYLYNYNINMEIVTKTENKAIIGKKVYLVPIASFDSDFRCNDASGVKHEDESLKYYVDTYVWKNNNTGDYEYYDNYGELKSVTAGVINLDPENEHKVRLSETTDPVSCQNITYLQYFKATWKDHLDPEKVAAYYIYLIRFGAVDQVVKNSMMTTEDGQHYYFINYDNDTTLGVRNDGVLIYNWDIDRNTFDSTLPGYAFAGSQSILWNCLEMTEEFMKLVQQIDNAMNEQGLLSAEAVLTWLNERQEGTWCQRLYNEQEKVKYLSTIKENFTEKRYLGFMHGTRHSHRNWWVNNRWELYDAKWSSGMYSNKRMNFIVSGLTAGPGNQATPLMMVTAASKYYFTLLRNAEVSYSDWFKEINREDSAVFDTYINNSVGEPILFYGPQKLKVFNIRPNSEFFTNLTLVATPTILGPDNKPRTISWTDDGPMMTKLLIGYDNESVSSPADSIGGLPMITSLEEVDIRGMQHLNSGEPVISTLNNLHRWRAKNSNAKTFVPAKGVTLYEVSLSDDTETIELNDVMFTKDTNDYIVYQDKLASQGSMGNLGPRYGDILPEYYSHSAYKYCKTYEWNESNQTYELVPQFEKISETNDQGELIEGNDYRGNYVFDYAPTKQLIKVTFNNVKGIDTYQFLLDLKEAYIDGNKDPKTCNVNITGFEWVIDGENAVADFIQMHKTFNFKDSNGDEQFGGSVYFNKTLNEDEYQALIAEFGKNVFKPGNVVTVNCSEGTLMNITGGEAEEKFIAGTRYTIYKVVQGAELKIMASIFPVSENDKFVYELKTMQGWNNPPTITSTGTVGNEVFTMARGSIEYAKLTNKDSEAIFVANPEITLDTAPGLGEGQYFVVNVCRYLANGRIDSNNPIPNTTTYIKVEKRIEAKDNEVEIYDITSGSETQMLFDGSSTITDSETHTFEIRYKEGVVPNVDVKSLTVSFDESRIQLEAIRAIDEEDENPKAAEIITVEEPLDHENQKYYFKIKHYITKFIKNSNLKVYITLTLTSGRVYNMTMDYNVICKYANRLALYDKKNGVEIGSNIPIELIAIGRYVYGFRYYNNNNIIEPNINYNLSIVNPPNIPGCTVVMNEDNELVVTVGVVKTTNVPNTLGILARPDIEVPNYIEDLTLDRTLSVNISYPDKLVMTCTHKVLTDNIEKHVNSNLETYSDKFMFNIPNNKAFDGTDSDYPKVELKLKALDWYGRDVNVSYATELQYIKIGENRVPTNGNYSIPVAADLTPNGDDYYLGNPISVDIESGDTVIFTPKYVKVTLDEAEAFSLVSLIMSTDAKQDKNITTTIEIGCKVKYDADANNAAAETPYFNFSINGTTETTKLVEFTMILTRSLCSATSYKWINSYETIGSVYTFYAVDALNRFFEVTATENTDTNTFIVNHTFASNDVDEIIGCGFVIKDNNNLVHPIFLSFTQFVGFSLGRTDSNIEYNLGNLGSNVQISASSTDLYNGYNITKTFAEDASHAQSIFKRVYDYNYPIKMYVPSFAELRQIAVASGPIVPSKVAQALNEVMNTLAIEGLAAEMKVYNDAQNYYTEEDKRRIQSGNAVFADVVKYLNLIGTPENMPNNVSLEFVSSTNYWDPQVQSGSHSLEVKTIRCVRSQENHSLIDSTIQQTQYADNKLNIILPFVNVG